MSDSELTRWRAFWEGQRSPLHREDSPAYYARYGAELRLLLPGSPARRVLEVGCGDGALFRELGFDQAERYRGVDLSSSMLEAFRAAYPERELDLVQASGHAFADPGPYDLLFANGVVQYMSPAMLAEFLRQARSSLAPAGRLVLGSLPWRRQRRGYLSGELLEQRPVGRLRTAIRSLRALGRDPLGHWYELEELRELGRAHGFAFRFYGSLHYLYRFHAVADRTP